jgi:hypothetical protein
MSPFITMWAAAVAGVAVEGQEHGRTASPVRLSVITISVIGWAPASIAGHTRAGRASAGRLPRGPASRPAARAASSTNREVRLGDAESQRERQPDMAATGDQHIDPLGRAYCFRHGSFPPLSAAGICYQGTHERRRP